MLYHLNEDTHQTQCNMETIFEISEGGGEADVKCQTEFSTLHFMNTHLYLKSKVAFGGKPFLFFLG